MIDVSEAIDCVGEAVQVKRTSEGSYTDGFYNEGIQETLAIVASVQPLNGRELQLVPEALRTQGTVKVYTSFKLNMFDILTWRDRKYEVQFESDWQGLGAYRKYIARLQVD